MRSQLSLVVLVTLASGCSTGSVQIANPVSVSLWGHAIGESAMAWAAAEQKQDVDPLTRCQELLRSPYADQSLETVRKCRAFVDDGSYVIEIPEGRSIERIYRFSRWKLTMMFVHFNEGERARVLAELDSRFASVVPNKSWRPKNDVLIEMRSPEEAELIAGQMAARNGFWILAMDVYE